MKIIILLAFIFHNGTATIDLEALKDTAAFKLQYIQNHAEKSLQHFTDSIDMAKQKIVPILEDKGRIIQKKVERIAEFKPIIMYYAEKIKSITGQDLLSAFDIDLTKLRRTDDRLYTILI